MTEIDSDIQAIVKQVLRRLPRAGEDSHRAAESNNLSEGSSATRLDGRLITLETLRECSAKTKTLVIARRAVITPAALDFARSQGWKFTREDHSLEERASVGPDRTEQWIDSSQSSNSPRLQMAVLGSSKDVKHLQSRFCPKQVQVIQHDGGDSAKLRESQSLLRSRSHRVLLLTNHPYGTVWQAGRHEDLRALMVLEPSELKQMVSEVPVNLLIAQSGKWNVGALVGLIRSWMTLTGGR